MKFHDFLKKHNAYFDVDAKSLRQFWSTCQRPDRMLWVMEKANYQDDRMYRLFACWCACNTPLPDGRVTWDLLTDKRSRDAVIVAIRYANGEATQKELEHARWAAYDAVIVAIRYANGEATQKELEHARWAAYSAARSAADSAAYSAARSAAYSAVRSAAYSAAYSAVRSAAYSAVRSAARKAQANHLRSVVDFKKLEKLIKESK